MNAGTFAVPNGAAVQFREVLEEITRTTRVLEACFPLRIGHTPEQSVITFLDTRDRNFDVEILTRFVKFTAGGPYDLDPIRRGCVHFLMGGDTKIDRMQQYFSDLAQAEGGEVPGPRQRGATIFSRSRWFARSRNPVY